MTDDHAIPPGWPGIPPRWTSSAKSGVGAALGEESRVWFTLSHGVLNEVFYPRIDRACIRDMGLIVTDGLGFCSEEKRHATSAVSTLAPGVPAYHLRNLCQEGRYRIEKDVLVDPERPVVLQQTRFTPLTGAVADYRLHVLLAPHLANRGAGNTGWVDEYKGVPMLFAERDGSALALACSAPYRQRSVGFVGASDGWQDLMGHGEMTHTYRRAENGNIALTGEITLPPDGEPFLLALAFGTTAAEAGHNARAALEDGFDRARTRYIVPWQGWHATILPLDADDPPAAINPYRVGAMVLRTHMAAQFPGGMIASLSVPWGFSKGDDDLGGYHLVWPRDLVESAGALLAIGARGDAARVLEFLQSTQEADGHWAQNMWLDGTPYWNGIQMDETALPILLVDLAARQGVMLDGGPERFWPMIRAAAGYLVCNGPVSPQDRWEEDAGYSPFTLGAEIAALLVAAEFAEHHDEPGVAGYLRDTADAWYAAIDRWTFAEGTDLDRQHGTRGHYVRIAPVLDDDDMAASRFQSTIAVRNVPEDQASQRASDVVSPDALALVRFGLRRADDPRIVDTITVIDRTLRTETPAGPVWHRYSGDGYGEHADGAPFDGTGIGRAWPLLSGERAHLELAAGRRAEAERLAHTMEQLANDGGLLPEQSWDAPDIPARELFFGKPSGSAMPLAWAHAEYLKLRRSLQDGEIFDLPPQTVQRYLIDGVTSRRVVWRFSQKVRRIPAGGILRLETAAPATIHWSADGWQSATDLTTARTGLGMHVVDLPTDTLAAGVAIVFTFHWTDADRWEGTDFRIVVEAPSSGAVA